MFFLGGGPDCAFFYSGGSRQCFSLLGRRVCFALAVALLFRATSTLVSRWLSSKVAFLLLCRASCTLLSRWLSLPSGERPSSHRAMQCRAPSAGPTTHNVQCYSGLCSLGAACLLDIRWGPSALFSRGGVTPRRRFHFLCCGFPTVPCYSGLCFLEAAFLLVIRWAICTLLSRWLSFS